jgi:hypothetical protein
MINEQEMIEGYLALAQEHQEFAEDVMYIANEVLPEWNPSSEG